MLALMIPIEGKPLRRRLSFNNLISRKFSISEAKNLPEGLVILHSELETKDNILINNMLSSSTFKGVVYICRREFDIKNNGIKFKSICDKDEDFIFENI